MPMVGISSVIDSRREVFGASSSIMTPVDINGRLQPLEIELTSRRHVTVPWIIPPLPLDRSRMASVVMKYRIKETTDTATVTRSSSSNSTSNDRYRDNNNDTYDKNSNSNSNNDVNGYYRWYIIGGAHHMSDKEMNQCHYYDSFDNRWYELPSLPVTCKDNKATIYNDQLIVFVCITLSAQ
jgi:hypothetical protein